MAEAGAPFTPSVEDLRRAWFKYRNGQPVTRATVIGTDTFDDEFDRALSALQGTGTTGHIGAVSSTTA